MNEHVKRLLDAAAKFHELKTPAAVARALEVTPQTLNNWETRGVSKKGLLLIQEKLGFLAAYIEHGHLPERAVDLANTAPAQVGIRRVPLLTDEQAAAWAADGPPPAPAHVNDWLMTDLHLSAQAFALELKGDSNAPEFKEGDRVIFDPTITPKPGDFVAASGQLDGIVFAKYRPLPQNEAGASAFELLALNPDYPSLRSDVRRLFILGVMVEHRRYRRR